MLEDALRASWSRGDLEVYADELQAAGDPRGELIALDLAVPADRFVDAAIAWRERRDALVASWVGGGLAAEVGARLSRGFLDGGSVAVLASAAGEFIREFHASNDALLAALAERPRPWLARLKLTGGRFDDALIEGVIEAAPNLEALEVEGCDVLAQFPHLALRRLKLTGQAAIGNAATFPAVTHLDIRYTLPTWVPHATAARFPALAHLDLSRNVRDEATTVFTDLGELPIRAQLTHVRMPALHSEREAAELAESLDRLPSLASVMVARGYGKHARAVGGELAARRPPVIVPPPFPWPDPATISDGVTLVIGIPDEGYDDVVATPALVEFLERHFAAFSLAARVAWTELWTAIDRDVPEEAELYDADIQQRLRVATLTCAVDACDALESRSWRDFRVHLRHAARTLPADAEASIYLYRSTRDDDVDVVG